MVSSMRRRRGALGKCGGSRRGVRCGFEAKASSHEEEKEEEEEPKKEQHFEARGRVLSTQAEAPQEEEGRIARAHVRSLPR